MKYIKSLISVSLLFAFIFSQQVTTFGPTDLHNYPTTQFISSSIAVDKSGNVFVINSREHQILKFTPDGDTSIFAGSYGVSGATDGTGTAAKFKDPNSIAIGSDGNFFVSDFGNNTIRKITPEGIVTTLAGSGTAGSADGTGASASFNYPQGLVVDSKNNIFVCDSENNLIRKVTSEGVVTTFAGSGASGSNDSATGTSATFRYPWGITIDSNDNLYISDYNNQKIRKITPEGVVSTFVGSGAIGQSNGYKDAASFNYPKGLTVDNNENIYVADFHNSLIRKITPEGNVTTFAGFKPCMECVYDNANRRWIYFDGFGDKASFNNPSDIAVFGDDLYVADTGNRVLRKIAIVKSATPEITELSDVTINEDESYSDTLRATDEEGDAITYSASSDTSAVTASITDSILTITPNANWNGVANIKAYASDGNSKDSTSFALTVTPVNDPPTSFEYITSARDTAIISSNLEKTYDLEWTPSYDVEGETITYKVYISLGKYGYTQLFYSDTTVTKIQIPYSELNDRIFEGGMLGAWNNVVKGRTALTVKFKVIAFDDFYQQYAGADQTADDRELYINRYDYLSIAAEGVPL